MRYNKYSNIPLSTYITLMASTMLERMPPSRHEFAESPSSGDWGRVGNGKRKGSPSTSWGSRKRKQWKRARMLA